MPEGLSNLRATNPDRYARAIGVMAAANKLCKPGAMKLQSLELVSDDVTCGRLFLTSNPPKREVSFTLDSTRYVAVVTITDNPPEPMKVE
jgi:hypothetical protein